MSRAEIGSSAVTPPNNTANRSSEIVPRMAGSLRMKRTPAKTSSADADSFAGSRASVRIAPVKAIASSQNTSMMP